MTDRTRVILMVFLILGAGLILPGGTFADVPALIHFQGRLLDASGNPVQGVNNFTVRIYSQPSGGTALFTETHNSIQSDTDGMYSLQIGSITSLNIPFDTSYWLGLEVNTDGEMVPRQRLLAVPYSLRADVADSLSITMDDNDWIDTGGDISRMSGRVGIGVSPPFARLHVDDGSGSDVFQVDVAAVPALVVKGGGEVGVGTLFPGARLHIDAPSWMDPFHVDVGGTPVIEVDTQGRLGLGVYPSNARLEIGGNGGDDLIRASDGGQPGFTVSPAGHVGIHTAFPQANFHLAADGMVDPFLIDLGGTTAFLMDTSGRVGIGDISPFNRLSVLDNSAFYFAARIENQATGGYGLEVEVNDTSTEALSVRSGGITRLSVRGDGKVGIGTSAPGSTLDIDGGIALRNGSYTAVDGNNNDIMLPPKTFIRITGPAANFSITGISGGQDGRMVILYNTTTFSMTLTNEDIASAATNRINTLTGANIATTGEGIVTLIYDAVQSRWVVVSVQG